ncbi:MAG: DUF429 domain-containing protein [Planctomycetes bacterium]|nr:DUF429 domain-containing protein [Planctomycetota bacterium]
MIAEKQQPACFEGIDWANESERLGRCYLIEEGNELRLERKQPEGVRCLRTAVDCPFGTNAGFARLLMGELPTITEDKFKSRATEIWIRECVEDYRIVERWQAQRKGKKKATLPEKYKGVAAFLPTEHVQSTVSMVIIPEVLHWLGQQISPTGSVSDRQAHFSSARRGEGQWVEAHPRMFLYSVLEKQSRTNPEAVDMETVYAAIKYKDSAILREKLYAQIRSDKSWMGEHSRTINPEKLPEWLVTDHQFDAFLASLTAWAHERGLCETWEEAKLAKEIVDVEGHILVLRQS